MISKCSYLEQLFDHAMKRCVEDISAAIDELEEYQKVVLQELQGQKSKPARIGLQKQLNYALNDQKVLGELKRIIILKSVEEVAGDD